MKRLLLVLVAALGACEQSWRGDSTANRTKAVEDCDLRARAGGGEYLASVELCLRERHPHTVDAWRASMDSLQLASDSSAVAVVNSVLDSQFSRNHMRELERSISNIAKYDYTPSILEAASALSTIQAELANLEASLPEWAQPHGRLDSVQAFVRELERKLQ